MAELPTAVLTRIFRFQSLFELKYGSMLVCVQWKDAASDPVLWQNADLLISPSAISCLDLEHWVHSLIRRGVRRYSFHKHCSRELIVRFCKLVGAKITCLSICGCNSLTSADINDIITNSPSIEYLDVSSCSGFAEFSKLLHSGNRKISNLLPQLENVNLGHTNVKQLPHYPLQFLQGLEPMPLKYLGLSGIAFNYLDMEAQLVEIFSRFCNLAGLDLSFSDLSESFLRNLGSDTIPNLDEINLTGCVNLTTYLLETIVLRHSNLKKLTIKQANNLPYINMLFLISKSSMKLTKLELCDNRLLHSSIKLLSISLNMMKMLFSTVCSGLRELNLSNCQLNNDFVFQLCKYANGQTIEVLKVASCGISDVSLIEICKSLLNLKELDISRNYKVTDSGLLGQGMDESPLSEDYTTNDERLSDSGGGANGLPNLVRLEGLSMMHLSKITDEGLKAVFDLNSLRKLSIRGCRQISGRILKDLSICISQLQNLDIGNIPVDDNTVDCLTYNMSFLKGLNISCSEVTNKSIKIIEKNCQCLRFFDISGCEHITEAMVRKFVNGFGRQLFEFNSSVNVVFELASLSLVKM